VSAPTGTDWSEHEIAKLRTMWDSAMTITQIAGALGRSRNGVIGKVRRIDLPMRKPWQAKDPARRKTDIVIPKEARHTSKSAASVAEMPSPVNDTRSGFARLMGDPLPGRSALDKMRANLGPNSRSRTVFHAIHQSPYEPAEKCVSMVAAQESFRADRMQGGIPKGEME
jgi:hypothetical protein